MKLVLVSLLAALVIPATAVSASVDQWWTTDHAEAVLMDSDWAFENDVQDASCTGWGAYKVSPDATRLFRRFTCTAYAERTQAMCLPGECASTSVTMTCDYRIKIRTTGLDSFLLAGIQGTC